MHDRLAPGTGFGDTVGFLRMIREKGIQPKTVGVEVISDAILAKGVEEAAGYVDACMTKVMEAAWPENLEKEQRNMKFNAMFSPVSIGPMTVPNRFVVPPMGNNFANTDGTLSSRSRRITKHGQREDSG